MANKKIGIKSSAQDNFLEPKAVTINPPGGVSGTAYGNASVTLVWTLPADSPAATRITVSSKSLSLLYLLSAIDKRLNSSAVRRLI
jgi:hypothetical protein